MPEKQFNTERIDLVPNYKIALKLNNINEIYVHVQKAYELYSVGNSEKHTE